MLVTQPQGVSSPHAPPVPGGTEELQVPASCDSPQERWGGEQQAGSVEAPGSGAGSCSGNGNTLSKPLASQGLQPSTLLTRVD